MRRLMAAEVAAAAARGETLDEEDSETSEDVPGMSDHQDVSGHDDGRARLSAAAAALAASAIDKPGGRVGASSNAAKPSAALTSSTDGLVTAQKGRGTEQNRPLRDPELDRLSDWGDDHYMSDKGHEADADDTSVSSRASSRVMGESIDSMSALYDSEYDNYYRGGAAGLGSDYDSDFFPEDKAAPNLVANGSVPKAKEPEKEVKAGAKKEGVRELKC